MAAQSRAARPLPLFVEVLGWLALLTAVALLSPGVTREASGEPASAAASDGPTCSVPTESAEHVAARLERQIARLAAQIEASEGASGDRVMGLNTSGYRYRPAPPPAIAPPEPASR